MLGALLLPCDVRLIYFNEALKIDLLYLLKPTPPFGTETSTCSYDLSVVIPLTNLGRPVDRNWEATLGAERNACILIIANWTFTLETSSWILQLNQGEHM